MLLLAALLATAVAAPAPGIPKAPLVVTLSLSDDMKSIQADVTNTGADSLDVIILHTPLSTDDLGGYRVSDKTRVLRFQGFISAYITTNLSDYHQTITSGQTVTTLWSLSLIDFTNSIGPYHASASGIFQYRPTSADTDSNYLLGEYESNDFQFTHALPSIQARSNDTELVYTEGCNSGKEYTINAAGSDYGQLADAGVNALTGGQDTAFAEFFGKNVSPTQYRTVTNRFYDLQGAKGSANTREQQPIKFSFSCNDYVGGCKSGVGAYVKNPERSVVTFCPPFFSYRMIALSYLCSTPSYQPSNDAYYYRGATLLHEFMHLESVMNSQPLNDETLNNGNRAYGYAAAKLLATQNAAKARKNPENYKYFAEVEYARKRGGACSRNEL
ncbi:hypothetical protein APHAL10511_001831 [Amanita phalloides]|nr:hypothetical protein APHAL10511_001831 [Amanita phalloides]